MTLARASTTDCFLWNVALELKNKYLNVAFKQLCCIHERVILTLWTDAYDAVIPALC